MENIILFKYNPTAERGFAESLRMPNLECKKMDKLCILSQVELVKKSKKITCNLFQEVILPTGLSLPNKLVLYS